MAVDIVINWAAEGLVLCFIHAVVDINPADDNNEKHKSGWTNWCGTPVMDSNQAQLLYQRLGEHVPNPGSMRRVFQILLNRPERPLWMSWPPDGSADGPTPRDFAKLAEEVQIDNTTHGSDAKTSCTRRYKALQPIYMGPEGHKQVESIFIPYGSSRLLRTSYTSLSILKALSSSLVTKSIRTLVTHRPMAIPSATLRTTYHTHNRSTTRTTTTNCPRCLVPRLTTTFRWVLGRIPPARSILTSNGPKARMDNTDTNGPLPPSPPRRAVFVQGCTLPIIQTSTRGLPSRRHITSTLPTRVTRDQSHHITTTHKGEGKGTEVMAVRRAMFRLRGLVRDGVRLGTSMELVEGAPENHPSAFRSALVVR